MIVELALNFVRFFAIGAIRVSIKIILCAIFKDGDQMSETFDRFEELFTFFKGLDLFKKKFQVLFFFIQLFLLSINFNNLANNKKEQHFNRLIFNY